MLLIRWTSILVIILHSKEASFGFYLRDELQCAPIDKTIPGTAVPNHIMGELCLKCLCKEMGCQQFIGRCHGDDVPESPKICGPYRIMPDYYIDCSYGTRLGYEACSQQLTCSERCIHSYMKRYANPCDSSRDITCEDYIRYHLGGPRGCNNTHDDFNQARIDSVLSCVAEGGPPMVTTTEPPPPSTDCPKRENPENGKVMVKCLNDGCKLRYKCNKCHAPVGKPTKQTCIKGVGWSGDPVTCERLSCKLLQPTGAKEAFIISINNVPHEGNKVEFGKCGDVVRFDCPKGQHVVENDINKRECDKKGIWKPSGIPSCTSTITK
ncbi:unnamed protein product [Owenia fusiformis]|uniref:lysozyme n=1 Tax=Owenia fusiformis TaxID=6347 RepID=A0A8J1URM1_OWEFU|nr:unnamed protein product [Owenia fusiformis]